MNRPWYLAVADCKESGEGFALITVLGASGSTPREPGAKMVITSDATYDTIGGGQLEYLITQQARELIQDNCSEIVIKAFPLAAEAKQCCGGQLSVMIEVFPENTWKLAVFGAGHVAQQLIPILSRMPCQVSWFDKRAELIQKVDTSKVKTASLDNVQQAVANLPRGCDVLILTHDHVLDYEIAKECLFRDDLAIVGMIGSETKSQRFIKRLQSDGILEDNLNHFVCPIGIPQVKGKLPIEIAVSICAQLIALRQIDNQAVHDRRGLAWKDLKNSLNQAGTLEGHQIRLSLEPNLFNED